MSSLMLVPIAAQACLRVKKNNVSLGENQKDKGVEFTSVEDPGLDLWKVLGEALVFLLDLVGQLAGVAQHHHVHLSVHGGDLVESGEHEHSGLTHT